MSWFPQSQDHLPLTWWNRTPVYLSAMLALAGLVSMVVTSILMAVDPLWAGHVVFSYHGLVTEYKVWTIVTYAFFNPPSVWLVVGTFLLWRFGEEVERRIGRRAFVKLVVLLLLTPPLVATLAGLAGLHGTTLSLLWSAFGIDSLELGVFLAFVTLYPRAQLSVIIATVPAWLMAVIIVGVRFLQYLSVRYWVGILVLFGITLAAWAYISYQQGRWTFGTVKARLRHRNRNRLPGRQPERLRQPSRDADVTVLPPYREDREDNEHKTTRSDAARVDAILEKISTQGMQSLTAEERRILEKASEQLKRKG